MNSGATVVFGGQAGSEGKGAIAGYIARRHNFGAAICNFMTNAGHTWISDDGIKVMVQQLPVALVNRNIDFLCLGAGSAITLDRLEKEINEFDGLWDVSRRLRIHPRAMIIEKQDIDDEAGDSGTKHLASTMKGCGYALARKVRRQKDVRLARDIPWLRHFMLDTTYLVNTIIGAGGSVLVEGSQGFDLDINHGIEYPYCTSRSCTPMAILADAGIPHDRVTDVIAVLRSYPIRVGNVVEEGVTVGHSGPFGGQEISWEEITRRSGSKTPLLERTTVTQRVRRIFEIDLARLRTMVQVCSPTSLALTFADYVDASVFEKTNADFDGHGASSRTVDALPHVVQRFIDEVEKATNRQVSLLKTGPRDSHTIEL